MRFRILLWLSLIVFMLHNVEEYLTMPFFIENHWHSIPSIPAQFIKPVSPEIFLVMLIEVTLLVSFFTYLGTVSRPNSRGMFMAMAVVNGGLLVNGLQHLAATVLLQTFTPGSITSILLLIPFSIYLIRQALVERQITIKLWGWSMVLGSILLIPIIQISRSLATFLLS